MTSNSNSSSECTMLLELFSANAEAYPTKVAASFLSPGPNGGKVHRQLTYRQLDQETTKLARRLVHHGLAKGDRAVLVFPPSLDFMITFLACLKAEVIAVPVFPPHPARRDSLAMFGKIVSSCNAQYALTNAEYNHQKKLVGIKDALTLKSARSNNKITWPDLKWFVTDEEESSSLLAEISKIVLPTATTSATMSMEEAAKSVAFLQYTSGSTSDPKGVMITHANLAHNLTIITQELQAGPDTVVVSWLPQYHDMGLIGSYLGALYCGGCGYYMSPLSFLQRPMLWIEAVSLYKATHLQAPNFAYKLTSRKFVPSEYTSTTNGTNNKGKNSQLNLQSVRHMINAAEPVDADSMDSFYKAFGPFGLAQVIFPTYGLAEHTVFVCSGGQQRLSVNKQLLEVDGRVVVVAANRESSSAEGVVVSHLVGCGKPPSCVDLKIVNEATREAVPEDLVGEIWVHSPSKAAGYYLKPNETQEDFRAKLAGSDQEHGLEYLRTGDLGFIHGGELFICGRLKDLIIIGGRNYYPQDLEATAESVSDAVRPGCSAAFTIDPTREGGEEVALVVELKEVPKANQVDTICLALANAIRGAINQEHSLCVTEIAFLRTRTVPKTSSGKIARAWCRKGFVDGTLDVVYKHSFKSMTATFEIEADGEPKAATTKLPVEQVDMIRAKSRDDILSMLTTDVSRMASIPVSSVSKDVALVTMLDSLTISQFKGLLENSYAVKISDEYLFRESTTLIKLVEVVKLGYAPDDAEGGSSSSGTHAATSAHSSPGTATGLAGLLGCPPGVVCTIL